MMNFACKIMGPTTMLIVIENKDQKLERLGLRVWFSCHSKYHLFITKKKKKEEKEKLKINRYW